MGLSSSPCRGKKEGRKKKASGTVGRAHSHREGGGGGEGKPTDSLRPKPLKENRVYATESKKNRVYLRFSNSRLQRS